MKIRTTLAVALLVPAAVLVPATAADAAAPRAYANCAALNKVYPHGVGRVGAHDKTKGKPVTTFTRSNAVYAKNTKSDRDNDKIACEKR